MRRLLLILTASLSLTIFPSCGCREPDKEEVSNDFAKYRPNCRLISVTNTENSPPCFYWDVKYETKPGDTTTTVTEGWQYCCSDAGKHNIRAIKESDSNYMPIK